MNKTTTAPRSKTAQTLEILRTQSLTTIVLEELERMILSGELKPGERINEKALAEQQSVSRGPIREACRRLEQAGLVEIVVNRGVFVRKLKAGDAADICDIKAALSALIGRALALSITDEQLETLRGMVARMEDLAARGDVATYYPINVEFHNVMLGFTGNDRLIEMCTGVDKELYLFKRKSMDVGPGLDRSVAEHRVVIEALESRDEHAAGEIMWQHAITGKLRLLGALPETENEN
ncbi:MAG: FCD domain-containing protein [Rhodospirillales bacterium]|nr:FCD domain-containing protein [Rhodospirillales bacterium]